MMSHILFLFIVVVAVVGADPNMHYQSHVTFFGDHPTPVVNMYVGIQSRQLNLVLEFCRPFHIDRRNLTTAQYQHHLFAYGHSTTYLLPNRDRKIHYSDTFHESAIPGASKIELYSEGVARIMHAEIIGTYREMPPRIQSAISAPIPPTSLSNISPGYHYVSGLMRIDGAFFIDPESLIWHTFDGFVLEHSQLNLISKGGAVNPIVSQLTPLRIPCELELLATNSTKSMDTRQDFCSFIVRWPVTGDTFILSFDLTSPFSYLPEIVFNHYYDRRGNQRARVDNYLAVEVGAGRDLLVLPPVSAQISYERDRASALLPVITLGRDSVFFYRDIFGLQIHPYRELLIAAPHPYHPSVNIGPKTETAIAASATFHVIFYGIALLCHYIFRGPTTNLLVRLGSYNSYDKWELRIETIFQFVTLLSLIGSIILTIVSPWRVHDAIFIIGTIGAGIHVILLCDRLAHDPIPLTMRLGITAYYPKHTKINEPMHELQPVLTTVNIHNQTLRKRRSLFAVDSSQVPLVPMNDPSPISGDTTEDDERIPDIYNTESPYVYWIDNIPHIYYNAVTVDFMRSLVNVNATIFLMMLFSLSYEFKFAFFTAIILTQFLGIASVTYLVNCAIILRYFTYTRRNSDSLSTVVAIGYGTGLILFYGIAGNILLYSQIQEANSFYETDTVPFELCVLVNIGAMLFAGFSIYNHIQSLLDNFHRIKLGNPDPKIRLQTLSSHV